jgi:hypothetical protein
MFRHSHAETPNPDLQDWSDRPDLRDAPNLEFFARALGSLGDASTGNDGYMTIGLVGQRDLPGTALRRAQAILRWDRRPSAWSHAFVVADRWSGRREDLGALALREVTVHSRTGTFPDPADNGVTGGTLGLYDDPRLDANVALLAVRMTDEEAEDVAQRAVHDPNLDRLRYNLWDALGIWQGWLWSAANTTNPLTAGWPMFSSAFVEYCFEALQLDLSPGASERNSAPEHLWNGARWWQRTFAEFDRPIHGAALIRDRGCSVLGAEDIRRVGAGDRGPAG